MMTSSDNQEIGVAIAATEGRLLQALTQGLQSVNTALTNLTEMHHHAILEQERRNASFATQERVEVLAQRVESTANTIAARSQRIDYLETGLARVEREQVEMQNAINTRSVTSLSTTTGYLVSALLLIASNLLTFLLAHAVH